MTISDSLHAEAVTAMTWWPSRASYWAAERARHCLDSTRNWQLSGSITHTIDRTRDARDLRRRRRRRRKKRPAWCVMVIWNLQGAYAKCILRHSGRKGGVWNEMAMRGTDTGEWRAERVALLARWASLDRLNLCFYRTDDCRSLSLHTYSRY